MKRLLAFVLSAATFSCVAQPGGLGPSSGVTVGGLSSNTVYNMIITYGGGGGGGTFTNVTTIQTNATTAQIQAAFDGGGTLWFTPSIYPYVLTTNIYITNGVVVYGNNNVFTPSSLSVSNFLFDTRTNIPAGAVTFRDCRFDGGVHNAYSATSNYFSLLNGTPTLYYNPYWSNRSGLRLSSPAGGLVQNCEFYRWPGNGLMIVNPGLTGSYTNDRIAVIADRFYSNFCGFYSPGSAYETAGYYNNSAPWQISDPEYQPVYNCQFYQNYMGFGGGTANGHIVNNMFTANIIGCHLTAAQFVNGAHGLYTANTFNHNDYGFWAESVQLGGFRNNILLGNNKAGFVGSTITESQISENWFGSAVIITNNSTGFFSRNAYQGSWSNTFACAITNAVTVCGNYSTTVAGNNDGISCNNSNITGTVTFPGTAVFTGTLIAGGMSSATAGSFNWFDWTSSGQSAGVAYWGAFAVDGVPKIGPEIMRNDVSTVTQEVIRVDIPIKAVRGILTLNTNYIANANTAGYTNSSVAPGIGGTNNMVARVVGTSGTLEFYNRSGANGSTVAGVGVFTNTFATSTWHIPVPVNSGFIIRSGVGVDIQVYAQ